MESVQTFVTDVINDNYWKIIPFLLIAAGIYFAVRTLVVQIRMIPDMFRAVAEKQGTPESGTDEQGISAFKAFTISAASRVGTGNVAGVAVAITLGGPGAVFWMWMIALLGAQPLLWNQPWRSFGKPKLRMAPIVGVRLIT